jgi:hypothetical protein
VMYRRAMVNPVCFRDTRLAVPGEVAAGRGRRGVGVQARCPPGGWSAARRRVRARRW